MNQLDTERSRQHDSRKTAYEFLLVIGQFTSLFIIVFPFSSIVLWQATIFQLVGVMFVAMASMLALWTLRSFKQKVNILPSPRKHSYLVTSGSYRYIRHPMYAVLILGSFGIIIAYPTLVRLIGLCLLMSILHLKMKYEETMLSKKFTGYDTYQHATNKLIPRAWHKPKTYKSSKKIVKKGT